MAFMWRKGSSIRLNKVDACGDPMVFFRRCVLLKRRAGQPLHSYVCSWVIQAMYRMLSQKMPQEGKETNRPLHGPNQWWLCVALRMEEVWLPALFGKGSAYCQVPRGVSEQSACSRQIDSQPRLSCSRSHAVTRKGGKGFRK